MDKFWNDDKVQLLKTLLSFTNMSYAEIGKNMGTSESAIEHAIRRYNLSKVREDKDLIDINESKKITTKEVNFLAREIGERLAKDYQVIKLPEPKVIKTVGKREEISILDISDVHIGMVNEIADRKSGSNIITYNYEIFLKELEILQNSIFEIHGILSNSYKLRKLVVHVLGDIITNDRIFPEQVFEVGSCAGLQMWQAIPTFAKFFNNLLNIYEEIEIVCIVGNHGRSNPNHYNEPVPNNFEYHIYRCWQNQFADSKRIKVVVPETRRFIHNIGRWNHLVEHGDQLKSFTSTGIETQLKDLYLNVGHFDVMHFGHIHKLKEMEISDQVLVKQNGCWIDKDSYAFNKFKTYSVPKQHFFGCNDKRKETWSYKLDLRG